MLMRQAGMSSQMDVGVAMPNTHAVAGPARRQAVKVVDMHMGKVQVRAERTDER